MKDVSRRYAQHVLNALRQLVDCLPPRRLKRFVDPITLGLIAGLCITVVAGGGCTIYRHNSPSSDLNRIDGLEMREKEKEEKLRENLRQLREDLVKAQTMRDKTLDAVGKIVEDHGQIITQMIEYGPTVAWNAAILNHQIQSDKVNLERLASSCRRGKFNSQALHSMTNITSLRDIEEDETSLTSVEVAGEEMVRFKFMVNLKSSDTKIYRVIPITHWGTFLHLHTSYHRTAGSTILGKP